MPSQKRKLNAVHASKEFASKRLNSGQENYGLYKLRDGLKFQWVTVLKQSKFQSQMDTFSVVCCSVNPYEDPPVCNHEKIVLNSVSRLNLIPTAASLPLPPKLEKTEVQGFGIYLYHRCSYQGRKPLPQYVKVLQLTRSTNKTYFIAEGCSVDPKCQPDVCTHEKEKYMQVSRNRLQATPKSLPLPSLE